MDHSRPTTKRYVRILIFCLEHPFLSLASEHQLTSILGGLFNIMGLLGQMQHPDGQQGNMPLGVQVLFVILTLMEQHPQSNAPGPASEEGIASLPKKKLDEKMLGPELEAECSVCMNDVTVGDEVVVLPCTHWFDEACATAWLKEHDTCPICRSGIGGEQPPQASPAIRFDFRERTTPKSSRTTRSGGGYRI